MGIGTSDGKFYKSEFEYHQDSPRTYTEKEFSDMQEMAWNQTSGDFQSRFGAIETAPRMPLEASTELTGALKRVGGGEVPESMPEVKFDPVLGQEFSSGTDTGNAMVKYFTTPRPIIPEGKTLFETKTGVKITEGDLDRGIETGLNALTFAGVKSKTFDRARLQKAQEMEAQGYHRDEIWRDTQTFRGYEGRWRQEISDRDMKFHDKNWEQGKNYKLAEIVDHPELYKAYPELKNVNFKVDNDIPYIAVYNSAEDAIKVNLNRAKTTDNLLDIITHEVQHKVQKAEGFEQGTNPAVAWTEAMNALDAKINNPKISLKERAEANKLYWQMVEKSEEMANFLYRSYPGEVEANLSMASRLLSDKTRSSFSPEFRQKYLEGSINQLTGQEYVPASKYGIEAAKQ